MCTMPAFHMGISQSQGATMQKRPGFMRLLRSKSSYSQICQECCNTKVSPSNFIKRQHNSCSITQRSIC